MGFFFLIFSALAPFSSSAASLAITSSELETLGNSVEWKGLLQYQKNIFGQEASEVAGANFFFSNEGKTSSVAELRATLAAFATPIDRNAIAPILPQPAKPTELFTAERTKTPEEEKAERWVDAQNEHPLCKFPARLAFANQHHLLEGVKLAEPKCSAYDVYKTRIQTKKLSVVFTSYFLGSASSIFGHSFLKFSGDNENELFDTGINFAASPTTSNPVLYALYGLIGVFPSNFSAQPFYYKVREYNDFESRDLWTYELNLTAEQKDFLLDHLWELGSTYYRYYYFNQNCSYHILRAIEGAVPSIRFFTRRPIDLIPSESIKLLFDVPNLVKSVSYRPSIRTVAYGRYEELNQPEKTAVLAAMKEKSVVPLQDLPRKVAALDTLTDALDLNHADREWKETVLAERAKLTDVSPTFIPDTPTAEQPQLGHGTRRVMGGPVFRSVDHHFESGEEIEIRASHHDLLDPSLGYPRNLHIDFGRIGFQYLNESKRILLNDLTVVDVTALAIDHPLYSKISYNGHLGFVRSWFVDCRDPAHCPVTEVRGGVGKAYPLFDHHVVFALLDAAPTYGTEYFNSHFKLSVLPTVGTLFEFEPHFKLTAKVTADYTFFTSHHFGTLGDLESRYVFANQWGLDFDSQYGTQGGQVMNQFLVRGFIIFKRSAQLVVTGVLLLATAGCSSLLYSPTHELYVNPKSFGLRFEEVEFYSQNNLLNGWYFPQQKFAKPKGVILFFHGNGRNRSAQFFSLTWVLDQGYDFMIFDYQGYGESDGKPSPEGTVHDGVAALQFIENKMAKSTAPDVPLIIFAQSLGGAVAIRTLEDYAELVKEPLPTNIRLLVLDSTFLSYRRAAASVLSKHWFTFLFQPLSLLVSDRWAPSAALERLPPLPVVVLHGDQDQVIDLKLGEEVYNAFPEPKHWILVKDGHHIEAMSAKTDQYRNEVLRQFQGILPRIPPADPRR